MSVHEYASEFFVKINFSFSINDANRPEYGNLSIEDFIILKYNIIVATVYDFDIYEDVMPMPNIYFDESNGVVNVYTITNVSKACELV